MKRIVCAVFLVLTLIWIGFIFSNSLDNGTESGEKSEAVHQVVNNVAHALGIHAEIPEATVRVAAHFTEFAVLGFLSALDLSLLLPLHRADPLSRRHAWVLASLPFSILVAVIDETMQFFSPDRAMQFVDVLVDSGGALFGVLGFAAIFFLFRAIYLRQKKVLGS